MNFFDLDLPESGKTLKLLSRSFRNTSEALYASIIMSRMFSAVIYGTLTPNDVRKVSTSVLLTLLMLVNAVRSIEW